MTKLECRIKGAKETAMWRWEFIRRNLVYRRGRAKLVKRHARFLERFAWDISKAVPFIFDLKRLHRHPARVSRDFPAFQEITAFLEYWGVSYPADPRYPEQSYPRDKLWSPKDDDSKEMGLPTDPLKTSPPVPIRIAPMGNGEPDIWSIGIMASTREILAKVALMLDQGRPHRAARVKGSRIVWTGRKPRNEEDAKAYLISVQGRAESFRRAGIPFLRLRIDRSKSKPEILAQVERLLDRKLASWRGRKPQETRRRFKKYPLHLQAYDMQHADPSLSLMKIADRMYPGADDRYAAKRRVQAHLSEARHLVKGGFRTLFTPTQYLPASKKPLH